MVLLLLMLYFAIAFVIILVVRIPLLCCCLHVTIATAIVGSCFGCSCCCYGVLVALGGKMDVMVTKMLIENVMMPLLMIKYC